MRKISPLQEERTKYQPKLAGILKSGIKNITFSDGKITTAVKDENEIKELFPNIFGSPIVKFIKSDVPQNFEIKNVGVILSGGQAPGGHNVIAGLYDAIKEANPNNKLYGFLGGPSGIIENKYIEFSREIIDEYRNTGGFDIIGSGRTKLETEEQFMATLNNCKNLNINAIVIIGGDDSNTNACMLAEWLSAKKAGIQVIGCPKTIDGDLKNEQIEISFGFDTATKTYSELIGNIQRDANSAKKYWHFIKLMGRSASHVTLEVALQTQPNITLISEEVEKKSQSLQNIVDYITEIVVKRAENGKNYGVCLVPEGLIEFIPEMKHMISSLNDLLANIENDTEYKNVACNEDRFDLIANKMEENDRKVFLSLPVIIKNQLLLDRDPHGNVQVSKIETEKLLIEMVRENLNKLKKEGKYNGKFSDQAHFFGYEGRCAAPSNFDADYCYSLGYNAFVLIQNNKTGYLSCIKNLTDKAENWQAMGVPLTMMMNMEKRHGKFKPVIQKSVVDINGAVFKEFEKNRENFALNECYLFPGAIQYFGPSSVCDITTQTLLIEQKVGINC